jgi:protein-S-isoprenylcysteine O-methyltransferase Ste14
MVAAFARIGRSRPKLLCADRPWLSGYPVLEVVWGTAILPRLAPFPWRRFPRRPLLKPDHRGIIINGPYRYTKHPAYFAENLAWWLVSVPWLADSGTAQALRCVALMPLVSSI